MRPLLTVAVLLALAAPAAAAGWRPDMRAARAYAAQRPETVSFAVRTARREWTWRGARSVRAASLMKPMLLAAYLRRPDVRGRPLRAGERALLGPMIRASSDRAAGRVLDGVGVGGELEVARAARMRDFVPFTLGGLSRTSARDQALFFRRLPRLLPVRHRAYALRLLARIVPRQRWGVAEVAPAGWRLHFKSGWGSVRGDRVGHQAALLVRGRRRIGLSITLTGVRSHGSAKATLRGIAQRLLRGLGGRQAGLPPQV